MPARALPSYLATGPRTPTLVIVVIAQYTLAARRVAVLDRRSRGWSSNRTARFLTVSLGDSVLRRGRPS